jgi:hypothetical protein
MEDMLHKKGNLNSIDHFPILTWANRSSQGPDDWIVPLEPLIAALKLPDVCHTGMRYYQMHQHDSFRC